MTLSLTPSPAAETSMTNHVCSLPKTAAKFRWPTAPRQLKRPGQVGRQDVFRDVTHERDMTTKTEFVSLASPTAHPNFDQLVH